MKEKKPYQCEMCDVQFDVKHKLNENMAERYPKRKLSTEEISRALNFESDSR